MSESHFNELLHAPNRLKICAALEHVDELEFAALRDILAVSDSVLSKQLRLLDEAGYLEIQKLASGGRPRTWLSLSRAGRKAYRLHLKELKRIVGSL